MTLLSKEENDVVDRVRERVVEVFHVTMGELPTDMALVKAAHLIFQGVAEALGDVMHEGFCPLPTAKDVRKVMIQMTDATVDRHTRRRQALGPSKLARLKENPS